MILSLIGTFLDFFGSAEVWRYGCRPIFVTSQDRATGEKYPFPVLIDKA
jgi:hypothetical protein